VEAAIRGIDSDVAVYQPRTMQQVMSSSYATQRFATTLLQVFAGIALLLAAVGIYGVTSYTVAQRTREVGIRLALGAPLDGVTRLFVRDGLALSAIGAICGVATALALTRLMGSMLFEVSSADPLTYAAASSALIVAALLGSYLPARRAAKVDPMEAIRGE